MGYPVRALARNIHEAVASTMLWQSLEEFMDDVVPQTIKNNRTLKVGDAQCEAEALDRLKQIISKNQVGNSMQLACSKHVWSRS